MQNPSAPFQPRPKFRPQRLSPYVERRRDMAKLANMSAPLQPNIARFPSGTEPLRLHPYCVEPMRENLHNRRKRMDDPVLERFVQRVFADDLMVECYFQPRALHSRSLPLEQRGLEQLPLDAALRAALRAFYMDIVTQPHERQLAYAASLIFSCGLFHCQHPWVVKTTGLNDVAFNRVDGVRAHLLEWPLHQLRLENAAIGDTWGEVFDQGINEDIDPEQVSRIGTAVWLANRRVAELWTA